MNYVNIMFRFYSLFNFIHEKSSIKLIVSNLKI